MMRRPCGNSDAGFTLIEVLVALVIATVALSELAQSPLLAWRGLSMVARREAALALARNELERAGKEWPLASGRIAGSAADGMRFVVEAIPRAGDGSTRSRVGLYWVSVEVSWPDPRGLAPGRLSLGAYKRSTAPEIQP